MGLCALSVAAAFAGLGLIGAQTASAVPVEGSALKWAADRPSGITQAQYYERHGRHGVVKCYRDFVIGRYRCHHYW
jgi:hypothetical protein